jgi:uncharacterized LabA/DUF88 family protein
MVKTRSTADTEAASPNGDPGEGYGEVDLGRAISDAALFIDWDNLKLGLRDLGRVPNISSILDAARERGRVVVARAYADWQQNTHHLDPPNLYRAGIDPVYIPSRMIGDSKLLKNSADVKLAVDCIDYCNTFKHVQTFILVSGDADLVHLATYLRMQGKYVVGIGVSGASSSQLADSVDEFLLYDIDIEPPSVPREHPARRAGVQERRALQRMFNNLVNIVKRESRHGEGALFSAIATEMRHRYDFQPKRFGFSGFKQFMQEAERQGIIKIVTEGMQDWAYLPEDYERMVAMEQQDETAPEQGDEDFDSSVSLSDLDENTRRDFIRFIANLEAKSKYLRLPYVVANLRSSSILPSLSRAQLRSLVRDAVRQGLFKEGRITVKDHTTGEPRELDTLELDRNHPLVSQALAAEPAKVAS